MRISALPAATFAFISDNIHIFVFTITNTLKENAHELSTNIQPYQNTTNKQCVEPQCIKNDESWFITWHKSKRYLPSLLQQKHKYLTTHNGGLLRSSAQKISIQIVFIKPNVILTHFSLNSHLEKADNCVSIAAQKPVRKRLSVPESKVFLHFFFAFRSQYSSKYLRLLMVHLY